MKTGSTATRTTAFTIAAVLCGVGCSQKSDQALSGPTQTNALSLIVPNVSVGKIRAGMTLPQAAAELGEPRRPTPNSLEYPQLGLAVVAGADGQAQAVMCGDITGINGPFVKAFAARTKEGIGMNSTREEVIRAFGQPTARKQSGPRLEWLQYEPLGLTISLEGGKVHHLVVSLGTPQEPNRTVTLEPTPQAPRDR